MDCWMEDFTDTVTWLPGMEAYSAGPASCVIELRLTELRRTKARHSRRCLARKVRPVAENVPLATEKCVMQIDTSNGGLLLSLSCSPRATGRRIAQ
jgi:hypothetical protein